MFPTNKFLSLQISYISISASFALEQMSDEKMAKKIYDGKVSGKRLRVPPRLTFKNTVSKILIEGHVKSIDDSGRGEKGIKG